MSKETKPSSRPKPLYRVRNWSTSEKPLMHRESIMFWLSDDFGQTWLYTGEKRRGSQCDYSDKVIKSCWPSRSVLCDQSSDRRGNAFGARHVDPVACTQAFDPFRTRSGVWVALPKKIYGNLNLVLDSTGLKVYREGEWKARTHRYSKQRIWRKLHVDANPDGDAR